MELVLIFLVWLVLGAATAYLANQKGRDPLLWSMGVLALSLFGLPFAVIGVAILYFLPAVEEVEESEELLSEELLSTLKENLSEHDIISREWFFYDSNKQQHGPVAFGELQQAWNAGTLEAEGYVWCEGLDEWRSVTSIPELADALKDFPQQTIEEIDKD